MVGTWIFVILFFLSFECLSKDPYLPCLKFKIHCIYQKNFKYISQPIILKDNFKAEQIF